MVNDTYDFDVGRRLKNLEVLKAAGFAANRRLLGVQRISHDCSIGGKRFDDLHASRIVAGQRASSLRFGDPRVHALFAALVAFRLLPKGFTNRDLRETVAPLMALSVEDCHRNRTTCDLRRMRLRGLIERIPPPRVATGSPRMARTALCYHRTHARVMKPAIAVSFDPATRSTARLHRVIDAFDHEINRLREGRQLAA